MSKKSESQFRYFKQLYQDNKFDVLLKEPGSLYWLKLRSISRKELLKNFSAFAGLNASAVKTKDLFEFVYQVNPPEALLNKFIAQTYNAQRAERKTGETTLVSQLFKMKVFDWGGLYQNNLERTIVNNYVKKIRSFDILNKRIENEIHASMRGYVQCSWYNHWTSILIEDIFKDHKKVIPTVGLVKKIDFFADGIPFDMKVTYFPDGFMAEERKKDGLLSEYQEVKKFAESIGLQYDRKQKEKAIFSELLTRIAESNKAQVKTFYKNFTRTRWAIIKRTMRNPTALIKWLYQEQGERRFDAANRLFLILIDKHSLEESWKMKRNFELLKDKINRYLDKFNPGNVSNLKTEFDWIDGKRYAVLSDVIFIIKE